MPRRLNLPDSASVATPDEGGKLFAPSAARNVTPLVDALQKIAPNKGAALEIASGTGQHVAAYARAFPQLNWHPTEIAPERIASIEAYLTEAALPNVAQPQILDATSPKWSDGIRSFEFVLLSNLLHLISRPEANILLSEAAKALAPSGTLAIYGPFSRNGTLVSAGDQDFDASLRAQDPEIGYKSDTDVLAIGQTHGLQSKEPIEMPANNLMLVWQKPA